MLILIVLNQLLTFARINFEFYVMINWRLNLLNQDKQCY